MVGRRSGGCQAGAHARPRPLAPDVTTAKATAPKWHTRGGTRAVVRAHMGALGCHTCGGVGVKYPYGTACPPPATRRGSQAVAHARLPSWGTCAEGVGRRLQAALLVRRRERNGLLVGRRSGGYQAGAHARLPSGARAEGVGRKPHTARHCLSAAAKRGDCQAVAHARVPSGTLAKMRSLADRRRAMSSDANKNLSRNGHGSPPRPENAGAAHGSRIGSKTPTPDALTLAAEVFALARDVQAVVFCSDIPVVRRQDRAPTRRRMDRLLRDVHDLFGRGDEAGARALVTGASWPGPTAMWWVESPADLTQRITGLYEMLRGAKGGDNVDSHLLSPRAAFLGLWEDVAGT